jgi:diguanylate cyclase (GGDEF)-like protein
MAPFGTWYRRQVPDLRNTDRSEYTVFTFLPRADSKQLLRMRRQLMSFASYLLMFAVMLGACWMDLLPLTMTLEIVVGGILFNIVLYGVIRSGFNLRFSDPSLTALQVTIPLAMVSYGMYFADHSRGVFLMVYLVVILFGVFRLRTRELFAIGGFALASYGAVIGLSLHFKPDITDLKVELLQWLVLGAVLPWFALLGGHLNNLRREMRDKNLKLESALAIIQEMATHDELTGVHNRRYLMDRFNVEESRSSRGKVPLSVCMIDLDFFKQVNDQCGHLAGDNVLRTFARVIQSGLRGADCFARYGGEEFVLLLADTPLEGAMVKAERMRCAVEETEFVDLGTRRLTASFGAAQYRAPEEIITTLARADAALYQAKTSGRNRVACAESALV